MNPDYVCLRSLGRAVTASWERAVGFVTLLAAGAAGSTYAVVRFVNEVYLSHLGITPEELGATQSVLLSKAAVLAIAFCAFYGALAAAPAIGGLSGSFLATNLLKIPWYQRMVDAQELGASPQKRFDRARGLGAVVGVILTGLALCIAIIFALSPLSRWTNGTPYGGGFGLCHHIWSLRVLCRFLAPT
jgi:hypothetical protein